MPWLPRKRRKTNKLVYEHTKYNFPQKRISRVERTGRTVIFTCSGASNCGQIANAVVLKLTEAGLGDMSCIAGVGAHDKKIVEGALSAARIIAVDGCGVACARKILEHTGVTVTHWINLTDYGIKKAHNILNVDPGELEHVLGKVNEALSCI